MFRLAPTKLGIALLTLVALVDLQIYVNRYHHAPDMLGYYLRRLIDTRPVVRTEPTLMPSDPLENTG